MTSTGVSADASHAEGYRTSTQGIASHAEGLETITNNEAEHAEGKYNVSHTAAEGGVTIHSVGIGSATQDPRVGRKNAFEILNNGDAYLIGVGGYDGKDITKDTLQEVINSKQDQLTADTGITLVNNKVGYDSDVIADHE